MRWSPIPFALLAAHYPPHFLAYVLGDEGLGTLYGVYPIREETVAAAAARVPERAHRAELASRLREYNATLGAGPAALAAIDELARPGTLAVVTGQQPALLGGPLYTLFKAVTAVAVARRLRARLGRPVVPVFWNHSDDHDLDEVGRAEWVDANDQVRKSIVRGAQTGCAIADLEDPAPFREAALAVLADLRAEAPGVDPATAAFLDTLYDCAPAPAFSRILLRLVGGAGAELVLFEPRIARDLVRPILAREVAADPCPAAAIATRGAAALAALGFHAPLNLPAGPNLFFHHGGRRHRVEAVAGGFRVAGHAESLDAGGLRDLIEAAPGRFSAGAALRVACQDFLFPTVAYVAGPTEVGYLGQLHGLHAAFDLVQPAIVPRLSATVVEPRIARVAEKLGLPPTSLLDPAALRARRVGDETPAHLTIALQRFHDDVAAALARLREEVILCGQDLEDPYQGGAARVGKAGRELERALRERWLDETGVSRKRVERALANLFPRGELQERVVTAFQYVARFGAGFGAELLEGLDPFRFEHRMAFLG